ncbi:hypothetical protein [Kribbella sp. NPDC049584]|uniref:hypothetical protein n=1 Tax=Kribbella sp. NPDC049584 TaxID=3154833 RepID=UPI00342AD1E9
MSSDFAFWKAVPGDLGEIYDKVCEGITDGLLASGDVLQFRGELLRRFPEVKDELEPGDFDLADNPEDAEKYVLLTLSYGRLRDTFGEVLDLAKAHGLVGFSGVAGEPIFFEE